MRNLRSIKNNYLLIAFYCFLIFSFKQQENEDIIKWSFDYKLDLDDFKNNSKSSKNLVAVSSIGIEMQEFIFTKHHATTNITSFFDRNNSWTKTASNEVLKHEQGHFDIGEIYARILKKSLSLKKFRRKSISDDAINIYNSVFNDNKMWQELYDNETEHGKNQIKQAEWEAKISNRLEDLSKYSSPQIKIVVRN